MRFRHFLGAKDKEAMIPRCGRARLNSLSATSSSSFPFFVFLIASTRPHGRQSKAYLKQFDGSFPPLGRMLLSSCRRRSLYSAPIERPFQESFRCYGGSSGPFSPSLTSGLLVHHEQWARLLLNHCVVFFTSCYDFRLRSILKGRPDLSVMVAVP